MNTRTLLLWAGVLGLTGVALGALGAHALRETLLRAGTLEAWTIAVQYQLLHAVALLALAGWQAPPSNRFAVWPARCWIAGVLIFSGSLYALALGGPRFLGPVTPLGGLILMAGWGAVIAAATVGKKQNPQP